MLIKNKKILVTGGSGFLGRHLLPLLLQVGAQVSCIVRSQQAAAKLPDGVNIVFGDALHENIVSQAAADQEIIIHMAGLLFGSAWQQYLKNNGDMATNLARAAKNNSRLQQFIFVSSLAAAGPCGTAQGRSETMPPEPVSAYGWSKLLAEQIFTAALGDKVLIVRPPIIYGSGDKGLLPLFRSCKYGFGLSRPFNVSAIHGKDCARSIVHLAERQERGIYHLSDGSIYGMDQFCQAMATAQGRRGFTPLHFPLPVLNASAWLADNTYRLAKPVAVALGHPLPAPQWNMDKCREAAQAGWVADGTKLANTGFKAQMSLAEGMAEAVDYYRREGML